MLDSAFMAKLAALLVLAGFLHYRQWQRARQRATLRRQFRHESQGIDVALLQPRLNELRQDYLHAAHQHARGIPAREGLVVKARRRLSQLPFFRNHPAVHDGEHHAA